MIAGKFLLVIKLLVTLRARVQTSSRPSYTKCWQPWKKCSSEKQDGELNCHGFRPRTSSDLLRMSAPSTARGAQRGAHSPAGAHLAPPATQTLPSFRDAAFTWVSSLSLSYANKVHAGQLLFILYRLKFYRLKRCVDTFYIPAPWKA